MERQRDWWVVPEPLRLTTAHDRGGVVRLAVDGEVDMATADALADAMTTVLDGPGLRRLVVDLAGVRFLASSGISVLVTAYRHAHDRQVGFVVVNCQPMVERTLGITGVDKLLCVNP